MKNYSRYLKDIVGAGFAQSECSLNDTKFITEDQIVLGKTNQKSSTNEPKKTFLGNFKKI